MIRRFLEYIGVIPTIPVYETEDQRDRRNFERRRAQAEVRLQRLSREVEAQLQSEIPEDNAAW